MKILDVDVEYTVSTSQKWKLMLSVFNVGLFIWSDLSYLVKDSSRTTAGK